LLFRAERAKPRSISVSATDRNQAFV